MSLRFLQNENIFRGATMKFANELILPKKILGAFSNPNVYSLNLFEVIKRIVFYILLPISMWNF